MLDVIFEWYLMAALVSGATAMVAILVAMAIDLVGTVVAELAEKIRDAKGERP